MKRKLSTQYQVIISDVLPENMLAFMQDNTMVPVNNLDETCFKPERCSRTPPVERKMEHYCYLQMSVLSTLNPVASSYDNVGTRELPKTQLSSKWPLKVNPSIPGTQRKNHANHVRRSIELFDSNSLESLRLETLEHSHDAITEIKRIVQE